MRMHGLCRIAFLCIFAGIGVVAAPIGSSFAEGEDDAERSAAGQSTDFVSVFECVGSIMHQRHKGALDSSLTFWFGVRADNGIAGLVTNVGAPLNLPARVITGQLAPKHDVEGKFVGGHMTVDWPYASPDRPVQAALMRETFIRVGAKANGISKVVRRTSNHTYMAGSLKFDPGSHPALTSFHRVSFISATCTPQAELPPQINGH